MKPFLIVGAGLFGRLVDAIIQDCGHEVAGFIDDFNTGPRIFGTCKDLPRRFPNSEYSIAMAIGYKHLAPRLSLYHYLTDAGYSFPPVVHPRASVSSRATIGAGCILMAGANVDAFTTIGPLCVLWPGVIVSHDSQIGENIFISPNATLCGFVNMGGSSFIGAGSVIVDGCSLPPASFVKAGSRYSFKSGTTTS